MKLEHNLLGERILIRNYRKSDFYFMTDMWFDPENGKYMSDPERGYVDEKYQSILDTLEESDDGYYLIIELLNTGEPIGSCGIFPVSGDAAYDIGYCIHKSHWKKGFGSEAVALLLEWLEEHQAKKVMAEVAVKNLASRALLHKFGFKPEKPSQFKKYNMDVTFDSIIYAKAL